MGKLKSKSSFNDSVSTGGEITPANYVDRAVTFMKMHGDEGFVIRTAEGSHGSAMTGDRATEAQWHAWMSYFADKGVKSTYALSRGMTTVPCEWPEDFDFAAPISDRDWIPPARPQRESRAYTPNVGINFSRLGQSMMPKRAKAGEPVMTVQEQNAAHLEALKAKYLADPVKLSTPLATDRP